MILWSSPTGRKKWCWIPVTQMQDWSPGVCVAAVADMPLRFMGCADRQVVQGGHLSERFESQLTPWLGLSQRIYMVCCARCGSHEGYWNWARPRCAPCAIEAARQRRLRRQHEANK